MNLLDPTLYIIFLLNDNGIEFKNVYVLLWIPIGNTCQHSEQRNHYLPFVCDVVYKG